MPPPPGNPLVRVNLPRGEDVVRAQCRRRYSPPRHNIYDANTSASAVAAKSSCNLNFRVNGADAIVSRYIPIVLMILIIYIKVLFISLRDV